MSYSNAGVGHNFKILQQRHYKEKVNEIYYICTHIYMCNSYDKNERKSD